jgi:hypothetical protein
VEDPVGKRLKHLCDWKADDLAAKREAYRHLVREPRHLCRECGRVAAKRKQLCKPVPIEDD